MKNLETQLKQLQSSHTMTESEHATLRSGLDEYLTIKPTHESQNDTPRLMVPMCYMWRHKALSVMLALSVIFTSSGGVVYASTDSLPGDKLYNVKELVEDFHEKILSSEEARAELAEVFTKRREVEMQRLEQLGRLDDNKVDIINKRLRKHQRNLSLALERLATTNPEKASRIQHKVNARAVNIQVINIKRLTHMFDKQVQNIESSYDAQENELKDIELEIQNITKEIIHN